MKSRAHPTEAVAERRWSVPAFHPSLMSDDDAQAAEVTGCASGTSVALPV